MSTLILTIPPAGIDATSSLAYVLSADGLTVTRQDTVTLDLLPASYDEAVAVVPAQVLSWHQVHLPAGSVPRGLQGERAMTRLRAILDGLLEERLLDDPADLHLALQPQTVTGAPVWAAACNRAWLSAALAALARAGHKVRRIVPEISPQSLVGTVLIAGEPDAPWVAGVLRSSARAVAGASPATSNTNAGGGDHGDDDSAADVGLLVCPLNTAALAQLDVPARAQDASTLPVLLAEPALAALAERLCQRPAQLQQRAERLLQAAQSDWNLAQFDLARLGRNQRWAGALMAAKSFATAPAWRAARLALLLLLVVNLVGLNAFALREKALLQSQRDALRSVLRETFPRLPVIVDAPLQMAREIALLQRHSGQTAATDLERMLAALADAPASPNINSVDYEAGQLRVGGAALGDSQVLAPQLATQGLEMSSQGAQWLITAGAQP